MENDILEFIKVLKLGSVEIWQYKENQHSLISKGPLEVLFNKDLNLALLKLHHFKYAIDRTLKVSASSDNEKQFRSYLLPAGDGCYVLRLQVPSSDPSVVNFETILENSCQLVRSPELETQLQSYKDKTSLLHKGENLIKQTYVKGSNLVSNSIDTVIHRAQGNNPNQSLIRKIEEIRMTEKDQSGSETFIRNEAIELMEVSNEFSKRQEEGFWNHFGEDNQEKTGTEKEGLFKQEAGTASEKTRFQKLNEKGHELLDKAKETLSHFTHKEKGEIVEDTPEHREEIGKILKREDELTDISEMNLSKEEKTRLQKLNEKGHVLLDKAKEGLSHLTNKITGQGEIKEKATEKEKEVKSKAEETQQEKTPIVKQVEELAHKASQKLEDYRDSGDLSSDTTIQPNREEPSVLDKANEEYGKVADKVAEKVEEVVGTEIREGESLTDKVKEKASELKKKATGSEENEGFKEITTGFSESVEGLCQEKREGEFQQKLHSKNPFENFAGENLQEDKPIDEKAKGAFNEASNKFGEKLIETKEKTKSVFAQPDKENAPESTA